MYDASDLRKGLKLMVEGEPFIITEFDFSKPGKGQAIYNCKLKNMLTGSTMSRSFRSNDRFEKPDLSQRVVNFSYAQDDNTYIFTDENFEEIFVPKDVVGDARHFLADNMQCEILFLKDLPMEITLPNFVEAKIASCEAGARGNTASGKVTKPATLESGYTLPVPLFVNEGETIRIDTRTGEYVDRVKS